MIDLLLGVKYISNVIEQQVKSLDGIEEAVVVGEPHRRFGEIAVLNLCRKSRT